MEVASIVSSMSKTTMEIKWLKRNPNTPSPPPHNKNHLFFSKKLPIYISTNPLHIDPLELRNLYTTCNYSCHRFPEFDIHDNLIESVDIHKLKIALSHSSVLVSVFCNPEDEVFCGAGSSNNDEEDRVNLKEGQEGFGDLLKRIVGSPVSPSNGKLVGFGRAVSDLGLTGSIYDVMVIPSLRSMGIGKMIVNRIIRMLTRREIYDISAVCSANERLFFKECGFGDDILGSTTMMYTRSAPSNAEGDQIVKRAGRKLLLLPPKRMLSQSLKTTNS